MSPSSSLSSSSGKKSTRSSVKALLSSGHGFFELGVGREADAEFGDVGRVVFFGRVATQSVGHGTETADVARWTRLPSCRA